jgi:hypothetical protein
MHRRRVALGALLGALVAASTVYVLAGIRVYANYQRVNSAYSLSCDGLIAWSPPQALYMGLYPNQPALVIVKVRSTSPALTKVTVTIPGFTTPQMMELQSNPTFQTLTFKPSFLSQVAHDSLIGAGRRSAQIVVTAQMDGQPACQASAQLTLFSRQWMRWRDAMTGVDTTPYIAGWVTPQDPAIIALIGRASQRLAAHPELYDGVPALYGYNGGLATPDQARDQVDALFDTLQNDYHVRYASDNAPFSASASQLVQEPGDVLSSASPTGMCVETTAILASAVERLGMRSYIVFTASHAFLGVALGDEADAPITYWETSDLNGVALGSQANADGDALYATDISAHLVTTIVDIAFERSQGIEPNE